MSQRANLGLTALLGLVACNRASDSSTPLTSPSFSSGRDAAEELAEQEFGDADIRYSFVVVGCNRADKADTNTSVNPSTANLEQLNRTFLEVAALPIKPKFFFFAGDMVFGYTPDTVALANELKGWLAVYQASPLAAVHTRLVPIPGNHEVQNKQKIAYAAAERTWLRIMKPYIHRYAGNGPEAGGADNLATDQRSLTYSFDYRGTHFVLLDTDPVGKDWSVPIKWIGRDLATARQRRAPHIFAIGHKPAYAYPINLYNPPLAAEDGLGLLYPAERDAFWQSLVDNHAEAMFSAHDHVYSRARGPVGSTWQIIAGNGGSVLEKVTNQASINFFGYTVVTVHRDGRVTLTSYGRDVPAAGYLAPSAAYPTTVRDQADITWQ